MPKIMILGYPSFEVPLTAEDVAVLMKLSEHHYDAVCRQASGSEGFIFGWSNIINSWKLVQPDEPTISAEWRQLDTCLKIMEMASYGSLLKAEYAVVLKLRVWFNLAMNAASETKWKFQIEVAG